MKAQSAEPDWEALGRYLAGESSPGEAAAIRQQLEKDAELAGFVNRIQRAPRGAAPAAAEVEAALRRVKDRLAEPPGEALAGRRGASLPWLKLAAALVLVAGAALLWRMVRAPARVAGPVAYTTGVGGTDSIRLGDGTLAVLGPASRLVVLAGYGSPSRSVALDGVAFFDVPHDPSRPFVVRAGPAEILDLGTRFAVRTQGDEVRVAVESGSVRLQDTLRRSTRALTLTAGQAGTLARHQATPVPARPAEADLSWVRGQLIFDNAPLSRVREDLRRWYGLELVLADSALAERHVSARFAGESPAQVLQVLELALGARIERRGDSAWVRPGSARRRETP
jgi:transmembrane sensor